MIECFLVRPGETGVMVQMGSCANLNRSRVEKYWRMKHESAKDERKRRCKKDLLIHHVIAVCFTCL